MAVAPILAEGDASSALNQYNIVANATNRFMSGGQAIIELATTPAGDMVNDIRWSTVHQTAMRWTGTQWVFADGVPGYLEGTDLISLNGWTASLLVSGTSVQTINLSNGLHQGVQQISSSVSANSGARLESILDAFVGGTAGLRYRGVFMIPTSGAVAGGLHRIGFGDTNSSGDSADGMYLEIVNLTASFKTANSSTRTTNATTAVLVANTWYTVHIWSLTTTTARCVVVNDAGTVVLDVTNTTNLPASTVQFAAKHVTVNTGVAALLMCYVDYIGAGYAPV